MTALPKSIRKAAILITALDDRAGDALLDQMGPELAARVRNAILELDDIGTAEQQSVLAEFLAGGPVAPPRDEVESAVELEESLAQRIEREPAQSGQLAPRVARTDSNDCPQHLPLAERVGHSSVARFDFLNQVPPRAIIEVLRREQPQTVAAVIGALEAELAGQLLALLTPEMATDVLERMAWLDQLTEEVLSEIELQLRSSLAPFLTNGNQHDQSLARISAVLGAMDAAARERMLGNLGARNTRLARQLGYERPAAKSPVPATDNVASFRYRLERPEPEPPMAYRLAGSGTADAGPAPVHIEFDDFTALSDRSLRRIFAAADPQLALLALTGASDELISRICRQLPAREAQQLRAQLRQPGAIRLRDIDAAQQALAELASQLAAEKLIELPVPKHFAAAA